jgi:hypothetical protein
MRIRIIYLPLLQGTNQEVLPQTLYRQLHTRCTPYLSRSRRTFGSIRGFDYNAEFKTFTMGSTNKILEGKYPAKAHAERVAAYLKQNKKSANGLIYLEGQKTRMIEDNDEPVPFRCISSTLAISHLKSSHVR